MTMPRPSPHCPSPSRHDAAAAASPYRDVRLGLERPAAIGLNDLLNPESYGRTRPKTGTAPQGSSGDTAGSFAHGRYLCATIRPGLQCIDAEMTGVSAFDAVTVAPRCLRLSALIEGQSATMIEGRSYHHARDAVPQLAGVGQDTEMLFCSEPGQRLRMSGLLMMPEYLVQLARDLHLSAPPLSGMIAPGIHFHALPRADRLRAQLIALHASPYDGPLGELHRESLSLGLIVELIAQIEGRPEGLDRAPPRAEHLAREARARIDLDPAAITSAAALAHDLGTNESSLRIAFQATYGMRLFDHVRARRLDQARALVRDTRLQIAEIARRCGYSDPSNLTHAYRHRFGTSPRADRQN